MSSTATRAPPQMYAARRPRRAPAAARPRALRPPGGPSPPGGPFPSGGPCPAAGRTPGGRFPGGTGGPVPEPAAFTFVMVRPARDRSGHRPRRVLLVIAGVVAVGPVTARTARGHPAGARGRRPLLNHGAPPGRDRAMHDGA